MVGDCKNSQQRKGCSATQTKWTKDEDNVYIVPDNCDSDEHVYATPIYSEYNVAENDGETILLENDLYNEHETDNRNKPEVSQMMDNELYESQNAT